MNKKILLSLFVAVFVAVLMPLNASKAYSSGYYTYRSTVFGNGINRTGEYVYEIQNERTSFNYNEPAFFLTRIFNITNIDSFRFRHVLTSNGVNQEYVSPTYYPHRNWWSEIYYWKDFGHLSSGNYDVRVYIQIDGGAERLVDTKHFTVGSGFYPQNYQYNQPYNQPYFSHPINQNYYNYDQTNYYGINYNFNWLKIGKNVKKIDSYKYEIVNQSSNFRTNENVYVLTYLSNIENVDTFQIKYDVYLNGNKYYKTNEVPVLRPNGNSWYYNYSWANLGKLPFGNHEIRTYIKINNGTYRYLATKNITVKNNQRYHDYSRDRDRDSHYIHTWTRTNTNIRHVGGYTYDIGTPKTSFWTDENVKALTKISDIRYVDKFKIKHKLYKNNTFIKQIISSEQKPEKRYWEYNYTRADFGKLNAGDYYIKIYISVNNGSYKYLNTVNFNVKRKYNYRRDDRNYDYHYQYDRRKPEYHYDNTILGSGRRTTYYGAQGTYPQNYRYPRY